MSIVRKVGTTDVSVTIRIVDSTDGTPETGVVFNTSGIDLQYRREGEASTAITEATLAALTTAHTDGGFLHIGNGYYRLDLPDAACASGATGVLVHGTVTGMVVIGEYVQLVAYDPFDTVRLGLTALPNAAADAAGGLPISDAGGLDLDARLDAAITSRLAPTTAGRTLDVTATGAAGIDWANVENPTTAVDLSGTTIAITQKVDLNTIKTQTVTCAAGVTVGAYVGGTGAAALETSLQTLTTTVGAAGAGLTEAGGTGDHLTAVPWNAAWDAEVQSEVTDSLVAHNLDHLCLTATAAADMTAEVADNTIISRILANGDTSVFDPSTDGLQPIRDRGDAAWITAAGFSTHSAADVWSVATRVLTAGTNIVLAKGTGVTGFNDLSAAAVNAEVVDVIRTDTINSYSGDGSDPTLAQAILEIRQWLQERAVSSTTVTVYKPDGTTSAMTFTLDDATSPTTITRSG